MANKHKAASSWPKEPVPGWLSSLPGPFRRTQADGFVLGQVLPDGFEAYLRVFSPFAKWVDADDDWTGERRTWADMADAAGVVFHAQLSDESLEEVTSGTDPRHILWSSSIGELDRDTERLLLDALSGRTNPEVLVYFSDVATSMLDLEDLAWRIPASELPELKGSIGMPGPEYLWPADQSWLLHSNYDAPQSYLACSADRAAAILAHPGIEALEVTLDTRFDGLMDSLNGAVDRDWSTFASDVAEQRRVWDEMAAQALARDEGLEAPPSD